MVKKRKMGCWDGFVSQSSETEAYQVDGVGGREVSVKPAGF